MELPSIFTVERLSIDSDGKGLQRAAHDRRVPGQLFWFAGKPQAGKASENPRNHDLRFKPRQLRTEAEVHAEAEAEMPVGGSVDDEGVGILELVRVPVRCRCAAEDGLAGLHRSSVPRTVVSHPPHEDLRGTVEPKQLLDRQLGQFGTGEERSTVLRPLDEVVYPGCDEAHRGLVSSKSEETACADQL